MKRRMVSTLLCLTMAAGLMAGCSSGGGGSDSKGSSGGESSGGKESVVIWDYFETDAQKNMMQDMIDGFNESQDKYEASHVYVPFADYEKQLTLGMASGELPDLVILDGCGMASFIEMDLFGDVSDSDKDRCLLQWQTVSTMESRSQPTVRRCSTTKTYLTRHRWNTRMRIRPGKSSVRWQRL